MHILAVSSFCEENGKQNSVCNPASSAVRLNRWVSSCEQLYVTYCHLAEPAPERLQEQDLCRSSLSLH